MTFAVLCWVSEAFTRGRLERHYIESCIAIATLTFLCELGPPEYAMTDSQGYELSDRWVEAEMMKDMVRDLWRRVTAG